MATKINQLLQSVDKNAVIFSSWMSLKGVSRAEQSAFVKSGWLEKVTQGVYKLSGATPTLYNAIASYNSQLNRHCHIGASTALDLCGFSHFVAMGRQIAYLFTPTAQRLPSWLLGHHWDMDVCYFTTNIFSDNLLGIETIPYNEVDILVSTPERAFMEALYLSPTYYSLMDIYYVMEMLTTLRPKIVQQLLMSCSSVKVKRLFLYMAEKANHQWFRALKISEVDLGEGKRSLTKGGVYDSKYRITIPAELKDYE